MKIVVASMNPVKLKAVHEAFGSYFSKCEIKEIDVGSEVADQPMSDEETLMGAGNRAKNAKKLIPDADFWVGIEGGLQKDETGFTAFAWVVVLNDEKRGESRTTTFRLPSKVTELIKQGIELGVANDIVFEKRNSKQKNGAVGILTNDRVDRTALYKQAVQLALVPFIKPELY